MYTHSNQRLTIGVPGTPLVLSAIAVVGGTTCPIGSRPVWAREFSITVTTSPTVTPVIARLLWRPNVASATDQIVLETITVPVGTAIGTVVRKLFDPTKVGPGGFFVVDVTQQATAGNGYGGVIVAENNDAAANSSTVLESV